MGHFKKSEFFMPSDMWGVEASWRFMLIFVTLKALFIALCALCGQVQETE